MNEQWKATTLDMKEAYEMLVEIGYQDDEMPLKDVAFDVSLAEDLSEMITESLIVDRYVINDWKTCYISDEDFLDFADSCGLELRSTMELFENALFATEEAFRISEQLVGG